MKPTSDVAFTDSVKAAQEQRGSRGIYQRQEANGAWHDRVTDALREFIADRDSLYLATASADGQPYIQHRGGARGFVTVLDEKTLALADFSGNAQYISIGNVDENPRAMMFLMDYANRKRIKIWGTLEYSEDDASLVAQVQDETYRARVERVLLFRITAWDVNCPQHIVPRYTDEQLAPMLEDYQRRIRELEAEVQRLKADERSGE
ncbi:MAG: pyridoxamine 5'-phosphate oxidase family protein [Planctomycetota bacterium]